MTYSAGRTISESKDLIIMIDSHESVERFDVNNVKNLAGIVVTEKEQKILFLDVSEIHYVA